eukprot:490702-Ditylum_brightwellii.AAC.1
MTACVLDLQTLWRSPRKKLVQCLSVKSLAKLKEYIGCKVNRGNGVGKIKLTQSVLLQSYRDKFALDENGLTPRTPAKTGSILAKDDGKQLGSKGHSNY